MRLIIDLSSVIWTALRAGKDPEGATVLFNDKLVLVNGANYGYEIAINMITAAWTRFAIQPMNTISVYEGRDTKTLRISKFAGYKGGRDAPQSQAPQAYEEFNQCKEMLLATLRSLGAHACTQDGVEGDDIIAYLAANLDGEIRILTGDGDITALTTERVKIWRQGEIANEIYGPFPPCFITLYKALVGDSSDKIPGAAGYGEKAWLDLLCMFGDDGLEMLDELVRTRQLGKLAEDVPQMKSLQRIIDSADLVYQCYAAASMYPELVNTLRKPLLWMTGFTDELATVNDERLQQYEKQAAVLVNADNYAVALKAYAPYLEHSPFVALDIETATPDDSDEWLMRLKDLDADDDLGVDVFGSELVGLSLTFGPNMQYSLYFTVEHLPDADRNRNLSPLQVLEAVRLIPKGTEIVVHGSHFELPVLYMTWGEEDRDNGFHGFLPNVVDTAIMASEVDENQPRGLKALSTRLFDYDQTTYEEVSKGRKMHMIPAEEVVAYGCDDTIMTAGLFNFFTIIMEIEKTMAAYRAVEIKPAYVAALAFVQGTRFNLQHMKMLEADDAAAFEAAWAHVRDYMIAHGAEGTVCPQFTIDDLSSPAKIKEIVKLCTGVEMKTMVRTPNKLYALIRELAVDDEDEQFAALAMMLENCAYESINTWAKRQFQGEPVMDFDSPNRMRKMLYETFELPVRLVNKATDKERENKALLASAVGKFNQIRAGRSDEVMSTEELALVQAKAKTDAKAIGFALLYEDGTPEVQKLLAHIQVIKTMETRRKLFYEKYTKSRHWKDNLIHSSMNQVGAVTRRPTSSSPNLYQLPKKGEGVKFRECFEPHKPDAVVVSIDFSGQELRISADKSRDVNLMACYVGDNKKDVHSLTASGAMRRKWGAAVVDQAFPTYGVDATLEDADYQLFLRMHAEGSHLSKRADDLRKGSKNVNFASHYDAQAAKISETLIIPIEDAEVFLAAKEKMFPGYTIWKDAVKARIKRTGYATTYLGARRHLAAGILHENKWEQESALRQGPNFEIQAAAAEQTKLAMCALWDSGALFKYDCQFIANIYDELVASVTIADAVPFIKTLHGCMTRKYMEVVPEVGSISLGPNFGKQFETGDTFDEARINKALDRVRELSDLRMAA